MNLLGYRAFATELLKIAIALQDSDIRKLMADRAGKEYLEGGELATNFRGQGADQGYVPELQKKAYAYESGTLPTSGAMDFHARKKGPKIYQSIRDYSIAGLKGALTGAGVGGLYHGLSGYVAPQGAPSMPLGRLRWAAGIGAVAGIGDRLFRHREELRTGKPAEPVVKTANLNSGTFSPARELTRSRKVGHFQNKIHSGTPTPTAGLVGKDGRLPT
jgi:hypothetical protein